MICGASGTGKTHLGRAWAEKLGGLSLVGADIHEGLESIRRTAVFLDNARSADETDLFSLLNLALNGHVPGLLLASEKPPAQWDIKIPDLKSRLLNVNLVTIEEHEDKLLEPIIRKLFEDRGRLVSKDIVIYMLKHCDRSVASLRDFVNALDQQARMTKSDITKAYTAKFLQKYRSTD